jgi:phosphatidate cytidylyltransferase
MAWEWGRLVRGSDWDLTFAVHAVATVAAVVLAASGLAALGLAALTIAAIIIVPLQFGERALLSALGVLYVGLPAIAMLWLRGEERYGLEALFFIFAVVWATDILAYFSGRLIGGPKLWPSVSPNKTWSGLLGGVAAGAAAAAGIGHYIGASVPGLAVCGAALAVLAQAGDLGESALKRSFGVKDASNLIPGHGGFLDRMDGIVPVAVMAALLALWANGEAPAQALLFGH